MTLVITHPYVSSVTETTPSGGPGGNVGPSEWNANHTLTGLVSPAQGGTGITSGTGVTFFSSATVIADSGTLTANAVVLGGGANTAPTVVGTVGTTAQTLYGGAGGGAPQWATAAVPGGSNTNVQFNNSSVFGGDANFTYTSGGGGVSVKLTSSTSTGLAGLSIATSSSSQMQSDAAALKITGTWNNSGTTYDAPLFMNIVNTASASGSLLADLQVGGASQFNIGKTGNVTTNAISWFTGTAINPQWTLSANSTAATRLAVSNAGSNTNIGFTMQESGTSKWSFFSINNGHTNRDFGLFNDQNNDAGFALNGDSNVISFGNSNTAGIGLFAYNTTDSSLLGAPTNYERGVFDWTTTTNVLTIGSQAGGSGTIRPVLIIAGANSGITAVVSLNLATSKVVQFGDGGANANGWLNWVGQARVTSNVTSTSTSFADITGMKVTLQASRSYSFRAEIIATCSSSGGIQVAASSTTTSAIPTIQMDGYAIDGGNLVRGYSQQSTLNSAIIASTVTGTALHAHVWGTVTTTTTGASFKLQVAQQNLSATQTIVLAGSYLLINDTP